MENVKVLLEACLSIEKPSGDEAGQIYEELNNKSEHFPVKFPIQTVRCTTLCQSVPRNVLEENIVSTYPLIHEKVLNLMCKFLLHKRQYGTTKEQALYKSMGIEELIDRLLRKRSLMFCGPKDKYLLLTGEQGMSGWEEIGTDSEKEPLVLKNCLSYDEMKLSALLYVSGPTVFINDGSRKNRGVVAPDLESVERFGVIIGLIGTRLQKKCVMESQEILLNKKQNTAANGYGSQSKGIFKRFKSCTSDGNKRYLWRQIWAGFYGEPSLTFDEGLNIHKNEDSKTQDVHCKRFNYDKDTLFDNLVYSTHISMAFDCAVIESSKRAMEKKKMAYLHIVGIGLGVWKAFNHQDNIFVKTFLERLKILAPQLSGLSDVHLAYMRNISKDILDENGKFIECGTHPLGGIKVHLSQRQPSSKLTGEHENKLIVETYAWDGNAQPGNEFWKGSLSTSGDPAAACSSQVAELHNSHINEKFVCGKNLHVAGKYGVRHVSEYAKLLLEQ